MSGGFAAGFSPFVGLISQYVRQGYEQPLRDEQIATAKAEREQKQRELADQQALRDAAKPVGVDTVQTPGGDAPGEAASSFNPEERAQTGPTTAYRVGQQMFQDQGAAQTAADDQNSTAAVLGRQAGVLRGQGRVGEATKIDSFLAAAKREGGDKLLDAVLAGGDGEAAKRAFDDQGTVKFGKNDNVEVVRRYTVNLPGYGAVNTAALRVTQGGRTYDIPDAFAARHAMDQLKIAETGSKLATEKQKADADSKNADTNASYREGMLGVSQQNLEIERKNAASLAGYRNAMAAAAQEKGTPDSNPPAGYTEKDLNEVGDYLGKRSKDLFGDTAGMDPQQAQAATRQANSFRALGQQLYQTARSRGQPISHEDAAQAAFAAVTDPKARVSIPARGADGQIAVDDQGNVTLADAVEVGGRRWLLGTRKVPQASFAPKTQVPAAATIGRGAASNAPTSPTAGMTRDQQLEYWRAKVRELGSRGGAAAAAQAEVDRLTRGR